MRATAAAVKKPLEEGSNSRRQQPRLQSPQMKRASTGATMLSSTQRIHEHSGGPEQSASCARHSAPPPHGGRSIRTIRASAECGTSPRKKDDSLRLGARSSGLATPACTAAPTVHLAARSMSEPIKNEKLI